MVRRGRSLPFCRNLFFWNTFCGVLGIEKRHVAVATEQRPVPCDFELYPKYVSQVTKKQIVWRAALRLGMKAIWISEPLQDELLIGVSNKQKGKRW